MGAPPLCTMTKENRSGIFLICRTYLESGVTDRAKLLEGSPMATTGECSLRSIPDTISLSHELREATIDRESDFAPSSSLYRSLMLSVRVVICCSLRIGWEEKPPKLAFSILNAPTLFLMRTLIKHT